MQSLNWYARRLKSMPPQEILWRLRSAARDIADRPRFARGWLPQWSPQPGSVGKPPPFRTYRSGGPPGTLAETGADAPAWLGPLLAKADRLAGNRLDLFDLRDVALGDPIDWQRDHASGKRGALKPIQSVDYRDFAAVGDCKLVWEPNRHHQLVVLARAYRASGDGRYAVAVVRQLESWLEQNPFGCGMNWRSPLELGIRMINWVFALDFIRDSGAISDELWSRIGRAVYLHCWEIQRKYSRFSSANNHLIGEAAGVFCACSYFDDMPNARRWRDDSAAILAAEILSQTYADGGTREQALGYELFVMQFYTICLWVAEATRVALPAHFRQRLEQMLVFVLEIAAAGGTPPKFGDCDDGYVLDLGSPVDDMDTWRHFAAAMFDRFDYVPRSPVAPEPIFWLYDGEQRERIEARWPSAPEGRLASRAFPESGLYLLQSGTAAERNQMSVLFDCAELGYGSIAAHGHADALAFVLRAFGKDVFVDPGTYDYFSFPKWREYFRSTAAHNTVRIDGLDQSEMLGPFLWGKRADCTLTSWKVAPEAVVVSASHDGYEKRGIPVTHHREIELRRDSGQVVVRDRLEGEGEHLVEIFFHLSPQCAADLRAEHEYELRVAGRRLAMSLDGRLSHELRRARPDTPFAWVSPGYHVKVPSAAIVASARVALPAALTTTITPAV